MSEKRLDLRKNRRLEVRFGPDEPKRIGFTCDITWQGFFIQSSAVCRPGSNDNLKLTTCANRILTTLSGERKAG